MSIKTKAKKPTGALKVGWYKYYTVAVNEKEAAQHGTQYCFPTGSMEYDGVNCTFWKNGNKVYTSNPTYSQIIFELEWLEDINE